MKNLPFLLLFCFCIVLGACSDSSTGISNQVIDKGDGQSEQVFNGQNTAINVPDNPDAVPDNVYDWGKTEWPGDNSNVNYTGIQPWMQIVTKDAAISNDSVVIDYVAFMSHDISSGLDSIVDVQNYRGISKRALKDNEGALFNRWSYQFSGPMTNSEINDGFLRIWPGLFANKISHFWLNPISKYNRDPFNKTYYSIVCLKITGKAVVQIAADYYKSVNTSQAGDGYNKEAYHSPWISNTNGKFITYRYPSK